jgi:two-component system response regulator RegX3
MNRAPVVESRAQPRAAIILGTEGFDVWRVADDGETPVASLLVGRPASWCEVVVLEVATISPRVLDLCVAAEATFSVPVVVACESTTEADSLAAYAAGAAVVLVEPVGPREFVARVRALIRRRVPMPVASPETITVDDVVLDLAGPQLAVRGQIVEVPRREFEIATILMRNAGNVVTRQTLIDTLWNGVAPNSKSLDVQVGRLRSRLARVEGFPRILTVRGIGYRFLTADDVERRGFRGAAPVRGAS